MARTPSGSPAIGVCAIQGDFEKHIEAVRAIGLDAVEVRTPDELELVDRLILPGGESTTVGMLLQRFGLGDAIRSRVSAGMPIWGTCMGLILLARSIEGRPNQWTLGLLDATVRRNAFGAQVHSFECEIEVPILGKRVTGVFIRAPIVTQQGPNVECLAHLEGHCVVVRQGNVLGTSFHPELTSDRSIHAWFASWQSDRPIDGH